jgi:thiol:disulfide interchange protein
MRALRLISLTLLLAFAAAADHSPARAADRAIYPPVAQANADIAAAIKTASATHKRIILDFGGDWCGDCQVLDIYFHDATNSPIVAANFVVAHINVGHLDANVDIAEKYQIPLKKGVPALAVLDSNGKLLYAQQTGQFENMRNLESSSLTEFLLKWKPAKPGCSVVMSKC